MTLVIALNCKDGIVMASDIANYFLKVKSFINEIN